MKNFNAKSLICGLLIGTIGTIGITNVFASGEIKSAKYEEIRVSLNDSIIPLKNSLVSVVKIGENDAKMYMPVREILEYLGYNVEWNGSECSINISTNNSTKATDSICDNITSTVLPENTDNENITEDQADKQALDIIQKTGNWSYVKPLFPYMTSEAVKDVANIYIQKTGNYKNAEVALPYINKDDANVDGSTQSKTQSDYDTLASECIEKTGNIYDILIYLPHMSTDKVDVIVKDYIDKTNDFRSYYKVCKYMSTKGIDDTVKSFVDRTGDYGMVISALDDMSDDASKYVAKKCMDESKNQQFHRLVTPYLKK
jgi:hypothetical protein